ncbi:MAG TPA: FAD-dependent oxidoreductase [Anaerolineales bacterium]|nr:FAD-dependent oxidoreductase [Anaerolineales bacterium]
MKIVIIGAGPAGVSAAETIRTYDRQSRILMLSAEPYLPYSPPAMADHFITGSNLHLWRDRHWPKQIDLDYRKGVEVHAIDPEAHRIEFKDGRRTRYDRLVIATGSRLYAPVPGSDMPGVHNFKSLSAAEAIVAQVKSKKARTAVIVGAGFIGMEIALLLCDLGVEVTQIEMLDQVMATMLDQDTAAVALDLMRKRGVNVRLKTKAVSFVGGRKAKGVQLSSGKILEGDILIAATGVKPNLDLLEGSGIAHNFGIRVDDHLHTNMPDVYAAGDAVEVPDRLTGETYVHAIFPNAVEQGRVVGLNLVGYATRYEGAERMNSLKHLGLPIMAVGLKEGEEVLQEKRNGDLRTIYLKQNRVVGFQLAGDIRSAGILRTLMLQGADVRPIKHRLLDPNFQQGAMVWNALASFA